MAADSPLESIIKNRSTLRTFSTSRLPSKSDLEKIIEAGVFAPFPALGTDRRTSPRKFVVLRNGSTEWNMLKSILVSNGRLYAKLTKRQGLYRLINRLTPRSHRIGDQVIKQSDIYARMMVESRGDFAQFDTAPFWVIIAERRHMPFPLAKLARQSMGHCLQNIWLAATAMGMGVQPISTIYQIQNKKSVCKILGLVGKNWELDSFLVGYPVKHQKPTARIFDLQRDIIWH